MYRLVAEFDVHLPRSFLVRRSYNDELKYEARIDDFDVVLGLVLDTGSGIKGASKQLALPTVSRAQLSVARDESAGPPSVAKTAPDRTRSFELRFSYFQERLPAYQSAALEALNRTILFFKYRLRNPLLDELTAYHQDLQNPIWRNEAGQEVKSYTERAMLKPIPGSGDRSFDAREFTRDEDSALQNALREPIIPEIYEELLSDAQTAIFQTNLRRAILEMVIACEVAVKQAFFGGSPVAGDAYEFLEDKGMVRVTIKDLLGGVARSAFGQSFKDANETAYKDIDHLFRCRNKVAHRAEVVYRDDAGTEHRPDRSILEEWWRSIDELMDWLKQHKAQ